MVTLDTLSSRGAANTDTVPQMVGRPSSYTPELAAEVCERIGSGQTIRQIEASDGMPGSTAIVNWLKRYPEFAAQYARAKEEWADAAAEEIVDMARDVVAGELAPEAGRVAIDALKWAAGKRKPKVYGDRVQADVTVSVSLRDLVRESQLIDVTPAKQITDCQDTEEPSKPAESDAST